MAYKYTPPARQPIRSTQEQTLLEFQRWREQADDPKTVGRYDFPIPRLGTTEAMIRFELRGSEITFRVDKFETYEQNLKACQLAIAAVRLNEARGLGDAMREAYLQLPAPAEVRKRDPYEVLGVHPNASLDEIEDVYKLRIRRVHPDTATNGNGDPGAAAELNNAFYAIKMERGR